MSKGHVSRQCRERLHRTTDQVLQQIIIIKEDGDGDL